MAIETEFLLIFLFIFALTFGSLKISKVFEGLKAINAIIALVIAFFAASYQPFVTTMWAYLPYLSWFFVIVFLIAMVAKLFEKTGIKGETAKKHQTSLIVVLAMALLVFLTIGASFIPEVSFIDTNNLYMVIGLIFIVGLFIGVSTMGEEAPPQRK